MVARLRSASSLTQDLNGLPGPASSTSSASLSALRFSPDCTVIFVLMGLGVASAPFDDFLLDPSVSATLAFALLWLGVVAASFRF